MSLINAAAFANNPDLIGPLVIAVTTASVNIMNEDPGTDHHRSRVELARKILANPRGEANRFRFAVATNPTLIAHEDMESAVGDLQYVVDSVYDAMAGIATEPDEDTPGEE